VRRPFHLARVIAPTMIAFACNTNRSSQQQSSKQKEQYRRPNIRKNMYQAVMEGEFGVAFQRERTVRHSRSERWAQSSSSLRGAMELGGTLSRSGGSFGSGESYPKLCLEESREQCIIDSVCLDKEREHAKNVYGIGYMNKMRDINDKRRDNFWIAGITAPGLGGGVAPVGLDVYPALPATGGHAAPQNTSMTRRTKTDMSHRRSLKKITQKARRWDKELKLSTRAEEERSAGVKIRR